MKPNEDKNNKISLLDLKFKHIILYIILSIFSILFFILSIVFEIKSVNDYSTTLFLSLGSSLIVAIVTGILIEVIDLRRGKNVKKLCMVSFALVSKQSIESISNIIANRVGIEKEYSFLTRFRIAITEIYKNEKKYLHSFKGIVSSIQNDLLLIKIEVNNLLSMQDGYLLTNDYTTRYNLLNVVALCEEIITINDETNPIKAIELLEELLYRLIKIKSFYDLIEADIMLDNVYKTFKEENKDESRLNK